MNSVRKLVTNGFWEGRCGSMLFDQKYYLERYSSLKSKYNKDLLGGLIHFKQIGMNSFKVASRVFDVNVYRRSNADVERAYGDSALGYYLHYSIYGYREPRRIK